jgi:asparaginyl-tRNA synthetase
MYQNEDGETCRGFDMLVPRIGELIGGSQREESYEKLMKTVEMKGLDVKELD